MAHPDTASVTLPLMHASPCVGQRESIAAYDRRSFKQKHEPSREGGGAAVTHSEKNKTASQHTTRAAGLARPPRDTILSRLKEARAFLAPPSAAMRPTQGAEKEGAADWRRGRKAASGSDDPYDGRVEGGKANIKRSSLLSPFSKGRYRINADGSLEFNRLKDEVKFTSVTAAVRSVLENHRELLDSLRSGSRGSGVRSFVALVCKDAAKAGGYRLCMRYFETSLPAVVPWAIDAIVRGDTLARGVREVLQIGMGSSPCDDGHSDRNLS